jgi:DNA-binding transcriptional ArsR family regulator
MQAALRAVASPRRVRILRLVWDTERSSSEIAAHFDVSWPAISQNIRVLRDAGLLRERREGTRRLYRVDRKAARPLEALLRAMWERDLDRLAALAEAQERKGRRG